MEQKIEIKAKYSKGDRLFAHVECIEREPERFTPITVNGVSSIKILGKDLQVITYSVSTIKKSIGFEVNETNLYTLEEMERFLK